MNEKKLVMYMHAGSGNHGCEAIVNSLCRMIKEKPVLVSYYGGEDERYSLRELCEIQSERRFEDHRLAHILYYAYRKLSGDEESFIRYRYQGIFKGQAPSLAISIGGDNYCYDTMLKDLRLANLAFNRAGTRTVLLGCSIEPQLLEQKAIAEDLMRYHTIIARESITYEALRQMAHKQDAASAPQILCCPDPAFTLAAEKAALPHGFVPGNTVGINVSPMVQDNETRAGITMESYRELMRYIIEKTDLQIALIPHVVWELKGSISACRLFVGARTHATIAAYSSCVPTLVVGYSVKARGIARDLFGTEEGYVLPVQSLKRKEELTESFRRLLEREDEIRSRLREEMPSYKEKARQTGKEVDRLWEECMRR